MPRSTARNTARLLASKPGPSAEANSPPKPRSLTSRPLLPRTRRRIRPPGCHDSGSRFAFLEGAQQGLALFGRHFRQGCLERPFGPESLDGFLWSDLFEDLLRAKLAHDLG